MKLNIFGAKYLSSFYPSTPFPISKADNSLSANPSLKKISATHVIKLGFAPKTYPKGNTSTVNDKMYCLGD
jgi:hypothetical protein